VIDSSLFLDTLYYLGMALTTLGGLWLLRYLEIATWRGSLVRYQLDLPRDLTEKAVAAWLAQLSTVARRSRWSLLPPPAIALEVVATARGITHTLLVPEQRAAAVLATLRASLPSVRLTKLPELDAVAAFDAAAELRLTPSWRPLAQERVPTAVSGVLAALQPLPSGAEVRLQWLLAGTRLQGGVPAPGLLARLRGRAEPDPEITKAWATKQKTPLLLAVGRVAAAAPGRGQAASLVHRVIAALRVLETPAVRLRRRRLPFRVAASRLAQPTQPLGAWPMIVNTTEAVGLIALPLDGPPLPGLSLGAARLVPPPVDMARRGLLLGESTYPGTSKPLVLATEDRLRHLYLLGPTGTGKTTLIANLALQDIRAGAGVVVIDPKSDLVDNILTRLPEERRGDVVVLDPAHTSAPIGFNPLRPRGDEHQRELAAETTLHILRTIFRSYWGPRTDDLLRAALLTLVSVPAPDGAAFTLAEVPELLTNPRLRQYVTSHPRLDARWRDYWMWYDSLAEGERLQAIGPVLNKLRAFTHRTALRLVLGQSDGFDLAEVFTQRAILLVPLSKGTIGPEAATLLGALLVGAIWQATLARAAVPADRRRPVFAYLDEFQDIVRLTDDIADMLAQARALGLGLTLAHQYLGQLSKSVLNAVLGTARTQLVFQVDHDDAKRMAPRFAPLTAADLTGLPPHEVAVRLSIAGQTRVPVTGRAFPLPEPTVALASARAAAHPGLLRADIETALRARTLATPTNRRRGEVPSRHRSAG
jgi:hypothetical protein